MLIYKYIFRILLGLMTLIGIHPVLAQKTKEVKPATQRLANAEMREGNKQYNDAKYADAEVSYKKSMATVPGDEKNAFNLGNAMMQQKRYKEAYKQFEDLSKNTLDKQLKAQSFHNMGNAQMGLKDYQKAIDSYKNSLRINPDDEETRYNLALAQKFLKENPPQNNPNKQQNKDDQKDQDQKDQDDQKNQQEKPKPDEGNKDSKKDQDQPKQDDPKEEESKGKPKPQPGKMSEQQMKQLLEAMNNEERKTQDKVKAQQVKGQPQPKEKDW
jgi:Ca-activated chloride channel family protein